MFTHNMLRTYERNLFFSEKKCRFETASDLNKCMKQIKKRNHSTRTYIYNTLSYKYSDINKKALFMWYFLCLMMIVFFVLNGSKNNNDSYESFCIVFTQTLTQHHRVINCRDE